MNLGVNIDHVATLRQARKEGIPDILSAACAAGSGGADSITVHLRQDRRHIQDEDVYRLREEGPLPLNLEMAAVEEIIGVALDVRPASVCLVPEKRQELTTEGGLDVEGALDKIAAAVDRLKNAGIEVSLFIDPQPRQLDAAVKAGADAVELHTGPYANAGKNRGPELEKLEKAVSAGLERSLTVNAGHGLDYENVLPFKKISGIRDLNIGYSIICRSVFVGLERAVREMKDII